MVGGRIMVIKLIDYPFIIFMKVGFHIDEDLEQIIERKLIEDQTQDTIFWGYNGTICRPPTVQQFVISALKKNMVPKLVMSLTSSKYVSRYTGWAREFSVDGKEWFLLPDNVKVKGSKYAIVCRDLRKEDVWIDLNMYRVACGKQSGVRLSEYIRYRIDKACAVYDTASFPTKNTLVKISYVADLKEPYAVFVR